MKNALAVLSQIILFFVVFAAFSFLQPLGVHWFVTHPTTTVTRYFIADGFLLATALFLLILVLEVISGRLRRSGLMTALSYAAAIAVGFGIKLGFVTHDLLG